MSLSLAIQVSPGRVRFGLVAELVYSRRPGPLWGVIVALAIAVAGLLIDLAAGAVVGTVGLPATVAALGVVFFVLFVELERRPLWTS